MEEGHKMVALFTIQTHHMFQTTIYHTDDSRPTRLKRDETFLSPCDTKTLQEWILWMFRVMLVWVSLCTILLERQRCIVTYSCDSWLWVWVTTLLCIHYSVGSMVSLSWTTSFRIWFHCFTFLQTDKTCYTSSILFQSPVDVIWCNKKSP